jgi:hypothetical protein
MYILWKWKCWWIDYVKGAKISYDQVGMESSIDKAMRHKFNTTLD